MICMPNYSPDREYYPYISYLNVVYSLSGIIYSELEPMDAKTIGKLVRESRKKQGLTQAEAAGYLNVGTRFLSDLENGKPTAQLEKVLVVLEGLGFKLLALPKENHTLIRYIEDHLGET